MNAELYRRARALFDEAAALSARERARFLDAACEDAELRREVEELLLAGDRVGDFLEQPPLRELDGLREPTAGPTSEAAGAREPERLRIGPFAVVAEIGQGGMGTVYLAVREGEDFAQRVAVKVVRRGLDTDFVLRRFRAERQILAGLQHPNIARLYDGGTTADGLPYFVMEHIEGEDLLRWCDRRRLPIPERLELFRTVCAAVQYAHRHLVVHRDLKPGNILVTGDGVPKLLDFGLAKVLAPLGPGEIAETVDLTMAMGLMTPEYASPEQVRGGGVTTASDVYSLGVVLYELLTGQRPYLLSSRLPSDVERAVCDTEPERPSTRVTRAVERRGGGDGTAAEASSESRSAARGSNPAALRKRLAGDLDTIVLTALRKEPDRRYPSVEHLSEDLRRHLSGLPVAARGDRLGYRAGRFLRRHRLAVAAAALVFLSLAGGLILAATQARRAERERARAERRFADVRRLANSLLFEVHDAIEDLAGATPARQLIVGRALEYLDSLAAEASDDERLQLELAAAYRRIGDIQGRFTSGHVGDSAAARESYQRARRIWERRVAAAPDDLEARAALAGVLAALANVALIQGELEEESALAAEALAIRELLVAAAPGNADYKVALAESHLGAMTAAHEPGQAEEVAPVARAIELLTEVVGDSPSPRHRAALANAYYVLASVEFSLVAETAGPIGPALAALDRARGIYEQLVAEQPESAVWQRSLANVHLVGASIHLESGDPGGAIPRLETALAVLGPAVQKAPDDAGNLYFLLDVHRNLGAALSATGDLDEARPHFARSLAAVAKLRAADPANAAARTAEAATVGLRAELDERAADEGGIAPAERERLWRAALEGYRRSDALYRELRAAGQLHSPWTLHADELPARIAAAERALGRGSS